MGDLVNGAFEQIYLSAPHLLSPLLPLSYSEGVIWWRVSDVIQFFRMKDFFKLTRVQGLEFTLHAQAGSGLSLISSHTTMFPSASLNSGSGGVTRPIR